MPNQIQKVRPEQDQPIFSPAELELIQNDPVKMEAAARLMGAVNLENLFRRMQDPSISATAAIEFQKLLNQMGKLVPEKLEKGSSGGGVVINITRARDNSDGITIEGTATPATPTTGIEEIDFG